MLNDLNSDAAGGAVTAKDRVRTGPLPEWASENSFDPQFKSERESAITYLLFDTQLHAERRETFVHNVIRLETMQAVQNHSQWRLQFEPKTQVITLHSLKVRRGDSVIDQLSLEKAHVMQREEGLERFVIHGSFTFLLILEDVRPGDILDYAYTIETRPNVFPDHCAHFFGLPTALAAGKYHFSVLFNTGRPLKWKSSADELKPVESSTGETTSWRWSGEKPAGRPPEINTPAWFIDHEWVQVSDYADWRMIGAGMAQFWLDGNHAELPADILEGVLDAGADLPARIEKLIQMVQDDCRYLSVNLELGGYYPTAPAVVFRRRFGDCKDLSFLLVQLLNKIGVSARPVLVHSVLRKTVGDLLPTPTLFNHAVVEFQAEGKTRWIDTTLKDQGGGPFNRRTPSFELGLPVETASPGLIPQPQIPEASNLFKLHENLLLATNGEPSLLAVTIIAEGSQADQIRHQLKRSGLEELAKQRLQHVVSRFGNGKRTGTLQFRDDRPANQFVLADVFEVSPLLMVHPNGKLCRLQTPSEWLAGALARPEKTERKNPFALPYPCQFAYVFDVVSPAIQRLKLGDPHSRLSSSCVQFRHDSKTGPGYLLTNLSITTLADSVPADQIEKHRELVGQIWTASNRVLWVARGFSRSRQKSGFGELPLVINKTLAPLPAPRQNRSVPDPVPNPRPAPTPAPVPTPAPAPVTRRRKPQKQPTFPLWLKGAGVVVIVFLLLILGIWLAKG